MKKDKQRKCESCKFYRLSDPLKIMVCDYWNKKLNNEIISCNAYQEKGKGEEND
jgi:hypothetical protein